MSENWKHLGYAQHFCARRKCLFHLATCDDARVVSTIGHYLPDGKDMETTLGIEPDSFYETMVFNHEGFMECGCCVDIDPSELMVRRYADSVEAGKGHEEACREWLK